MKILHKIKKAITSTYMCIKYPFLYPRNRFTGLHYNNWKLHQYHVNNYKHAVKTLCTRVYTIDEWCEHGERLLQRTFKNDFNIDLKFEMKDSYVILSNQDKTIKKIPIPHSRIIDRIGFEYKNYMINFYVVFKRNYELPEKTFFIDNIIDDKWLYFKIKVADFLNDYVLQLFHCIPTYTEWDALKQYKGWYKAFGKELLKEIDQQLRKDKLRYKWRITDIKEKWGSLQIYCNYGSHELYELLAKYENISYHTCIVCGKPARYLSNGWICPYCEDHYDPKDGYTAIIDENGEWKSAYDDPE